LDKNQPINKNVFKLTYLHGEKHIGQKTFKILLYSEANVCF